jgi:hypothetical protein
MKKIIPLFLIALFSISIHISFAQINTELLIDSPLKNGITTAFSKADINIFNINAPANAAQSETIFKKQNAQQKKLVFGENIPLHISLSSCRWIQSGNKRVCKISLLSTGAKTLNIRLTEFYLAPTAQLFLYNESGTVVMGPITAAQNNKAKVFLSSIFPGENLMLELIENADSKKKSNFTISRITYGIIDTYKGILNDVGKSGSCEENVTCVLGAWHDEAKSAVRLLINGNTLCSACLVNNTAQDGTPYVLTANHCVVGEPDPENDISFVFFFRSKFCDSTKPSNNYKVYNQCFVRAHYYNSDFALLEMANKPDSSEEYFYSGWSRDSVQSSFAACLHFPQGDLMKYSESTFQPVDTAYGTSGDKDKMFWVRWTGTGVTEDGSSGGALYNSSKQLIGQLYDGPSFCGAKGLNKSDYFGGFFASWGGGGKITNRLKDWLDPLNQDPVSINGAYISTTTKKPKEDAPEISLNKNILLFPNPAKGIVTLQLSDDWFFNKQNITAIIFSAEGKILLKQNIFSSSSQMNIDALQNGFYILRVSNMQKSETEKLIVEKN